MNRIVRELFICFALVLGALSAPGAFAQCENKTGFAKRACEANNPPTNGNSSLPVSLGNAKANPITTGFADTIHLDTLPPSVEPNLFQPLAKLDRTNDGSFILKAGIYEVYVQSYALDAGDSNANKPGGYFPAPIMGKQAKIVAALLKQAELYPRVPQPDIQQLLFEIVKGTNLEKMSPAEQQTAVIVLPKDIVRQMQGAAQAKAFQNSLMSILNQRINKDPNAQNTVNQINDITKKIAQAKGGLSANSISDTSTDAIDLAARGTWAQMPGGFYVRYLPEGYAKTRLQVIVPDAAIAQADPKNPLVFDPTQYLAVLSEAPNERIGITLRPAR